MATAGNSNLFSHLFVKATAGNSNLFSHLFVKATAGNSNLSPPEHSRSEVSRSGTKFVLTHSLSADVKHCPSETDLEFSAAY